MAENQLVPNLQKVLASAEINNCLVRGIRQSCQAMESNFGEDFSKRAALCVLAKDVNNQDYQKLVRALAKDRNVPLLEVDSKTELGQWSGLCKYDQTETARRLDHVEYLLSLNSQEIKRQLQRLLCSTWGLTNLFRLN